MDVTDCHLNPFHNSSTCILTFFDKLGFNLEKSEKKWKISTMFFIEMVGIFIKLHHLVFQSPISVFVSPFQTLQISLI